MSQFVLYQQIFLEPGGKQLLDSLDVFLTAYSEVILALFCFLFCGALLLAVVEHRERRAKRPLEARQKARSAKAVGSRGPAYELLAISQDSIY